MKLVVMQSDTHLKVVGPYGTERDCTLDKEFFAGMAIDAETVEEAIDVYLSSDYVSPLLVPPTVLLVGFDEPVEPEQLSILGGVA